MKLYMIRHGRTPGNAAGRYVGSRTDDPLSPEGIAALQKMGACPSVDRVVVSGLTRTRETAALLFPSARLVPRPELNEIDFGDLEGKTAAELAGDPAYEAWLAAGASSTCPGGEPVEDMAARCLRGLTEEILLARQEGREEIYLVLHGGTIMVLMTLCADPERPFFDWYMANGACWTAELDPVSWERERRFTAWSYAPEAPGLTGGGK